jgi:glycosyltransferase involved in cell wall biosynthesis
VLVLAGSVGGVPIQTRLEHLDLRVGEDVHVLGHVDEDRLWAVLAACDVCVSLRYPTMGETSGSVIRALGLGRPVLVSDVGWFSELPDDVVGKIPVDETEVDVLASVLERLSADERLRRNMGEAARRYVLNAHDLDHVADLYQRACDEFLIGPAVDAEVLGDVSRAASDVGIGMNDPEFRDLARGLKETDLVR